LSNAQSFNYLPTSTTKQIVKHNYFTLSYSEKHELAEWVAYELTKERAEGDIERSDNFCIDPLVSTGSANPDDYVGSGYDKGHLAPAADMKFNSTAMLECFYMSNMSPQAPSFNRGIWKQLEEQVRTWAITYKDIYIVTGGVLKYTSGDIGANHVSIPKYFYKVVLDYTEPDIKAIALILPNEKGTKQLEEYVITIDSLESLTGIDFFPALPDKLEKELESTSHPEKWTFKRINTNVTYGNKTTCSVQCSGTTKSGSRCKRKTLSPNGRCFQHGGD
jgi:endonuclease G